ncbi:uncharacterized protein [Oscarella lobularis]|uniref:uncharacterized protein n=1 Tax=Oscarella lobularis TaxID=121494 RepID=UPI003314151C
MRKSLFYFLFFVIIIDIMMSDSPSKRSPRKKTKLPEFDTLDDLYSQQDGYKAVVHGVVTDFSAIGASPEKRYFDGYLRDDTASKRFVGFSPTKEKILDFARSGRALSFSNVVVQPSRAGDDMEFVIADGTAVWRSNRIFSNAKPLEPDDTPSRGRPIALEELSALRPFARVNFVAGVQDLGDIHTTQSGANVQRITIRDSSGTATLNAWGKHVDALSVGKFYRFFNMIVKEFGGANTHHAEARRLDRTDGGRRRNRNRPRFVARSCYRRRRRHPLRHGIHIQAHVPCVLARALGRIDGRAGIGHVLGVPCYGFTIQLQAPRYCDSQHSCRRGVDNPTHGRRANIDEDRPSQRGIEGNASQYHHSR